MMKDLDTQTTAAFTKIANMQIMNVAQTAIADVMGVSEGDISQILKKPGYVAIHSDLMQTKFAELQETDDDWDSVERLAIRRVKEVLDFSADPDFALKAATLANKAARRGKGLHNDPLPAVAGTRVQINLSQNLVNKLQIVAGGADPADLAPATGTVIDGDSLEHEPQQSQQLKEQPVAEPRDPVKALQLAARSKQKLTNSLPTSAVKSLFGADKEDSASRGRDTVSSMIDQVFADTGLIAQT